MRSSRAARRGPGALWLLASVVLAAIVIVIGVYQAVDGTWPGTASSPAAGATRSPGPSPTSGAQSTQRSPGTPEQHEFWDAAGGYETEQALARWDDERQITLHTLPFPAWSVPTNPAWDEDPYENQSWTFWYHSLAWLKTPAYGFRTTGHEAYAEQVISYLFDWIEDNPRPEPASRRAWYDHAVAIRTDTMVSLHAQLLEGWLETPQREVLETSLHLHGRVLRAYMDSERFVGHNHNYFHALSLYQLATHFPELEGADEWRSRARLRISELMSEMVDPDGVSTEQSASYQLIAISLFTRADAYLRQFGDGFGGGERDLLLKMVQFAALLIRSDGTGPPFGDTAYRNNLEGRLRQLTTDDLLTPWAAHILAEPAVRSPSNSPPDLVVLPHAGYVIMRPANQSGSHLFADFGLERRVHGHWDQLAFSYFSAGLDVLVDSGGPYEYGARGRGQFMAPHSHNTVVIDGETSQSGDARLLGSHDDARVSMARGLRRSETGVVHTRSLIMLKEHDVLLIVDELSPDRAGQHQYELMLQLPPEAQVNTVPGGLEADLAGTTRANIALRASSEPEIAVYQGLDGERWLGWVTDGTRSRLPAPAVVARLTAGDAWLVSAIRLDRQAPELVDLDRRGEQLELRLVVDGSKLELVIGAQSVELREQLVGP
jgi:hypothetical protein